MVEFFTNESATGLVAQPQRSIRVGTRRTETGVTHAAMNFEGFSRRSLVPAQESSFSELHGHQ